MVEQQYPINIKKRMTFSMDQYLLNVCGIYPVSASATITLQSAFPQSVRVSEKPVQVRFDNPCGSLPAWNIPWFYITTTILRKPNRVQQTHFLPGVLSITQHLTRKMQHELPLQVLKSSRFSASVTNPFLKQQPSFPFIANSTGPTGGQPVSSNPVSNCRVQLPSLD